MAQDVSSAPQGKMTPEQFVYWLQGFAELTQGAHPTPEQWKSITEHLQTVFVKVTEPLYKLTPDSYFKPRNPPSTITC